MHNAISNVMPKKILYAVQGEGRGHASRSLPIIRKLRENGHELLILTGGDALGLLKGACRFEKLGGLRRIPIFRYHYNVAGRLSLLSTFINNFSGGLGLMFAAGKRFKLIFKKVGEFKPDMIVSDFEPYSSRCASLLRIPLFSVNHQHFLTECKLPTPSRLSKAFVIFGFQIFTRFFTGKPDKIITSSFYHFPPKEESSANFVGPILSDKVKGLVPSTKNHITIYVKKPALMKRLLPVLAKLPDFEFHAFSKWENEPEKWKINAPNVRFEAIHQDRFLTSLANSRALITTAGNQVLGEAIYLKKPIFAFPEPGVVEQELNALALRESGFGDVVDLDKLNVKHLSSFLAKIPGFLKQGDWERVLEGYDGCGPIVGEIESYIQGNGWQDAPTRKMEAQTVSVA